MAGNAGHHRLGRYTGPYLADLTRADATRAPRNWKEFLMSHGWRSYNLAEGMSHQQERVTENLVYYLPNYFRLMLGIILISM
jgi:hypothetical protein